MDNYCLTVTYRCNWACSYCITDTHSKSIEWNKVIENAKKSPHNSHVSLTGGEPGLLSSNELKEIIKILREKNNIIQINSNGEIFKKPEIVNLVDEIFYHCSQDLNQNDDIIKNYKEKTQFMIVVTDDNFKRLESFLEKHNDIDIEIHPATGFLSKKNIIKLYTNFKSYFKEEDLKRLFNFREHMKETIKI